MHGERFDLTYPGKHLLINISRKTPPKNALLRVDAEAIKIGGQCTDIYFQEINVSGSWASEKQAGGYRHTIKSAFKEAPKWVVLGNISLKVAHGRTQNGFAYLNFYAKHLGQAGFAVGGLLGEDDHDEVSKPQEGCVSRIQLQRVGTDVQESSVAEGYSD